MGVGFIRVLCLVHMWLGICKPGGPAGSDKGLRKKLLRAKRGNLNRGEQQLIPWFLSRRNHTKLASTHDSIGQVNRIVLAGSTPPKNLCFCAVDCRRFSARHSAAGLWGGVIYLESCPPAFLLSVKQAAVLPVDSNTVIYFVLEKSPPDVQFCEHHTTFLFSSPPAFCPQPP